MTEPLFDNNMHDDDDHQYQPIEGACICSIDDINYAPWVMRCCVSQASISGQSPLIYSYSDPRINDLFKKVASSLNNDSNGLEFDSSGGPMAPRPFSKNRIFHQASWGKGGKPVLAEFPCISVLNNNLMNDKIVRSEIVLAKALEFSCQATTPAAEEDTIASFIRYMSIAMSIDTLYLVVSKDYLFDDFDHDQQWYKSWHTDRDAHKASICAAAKTLALRQWRDLLEIGKLGPYPVGVYAMAPSSSLEDRSTQIDYFQANVHVSIDHEFNILGMKIGWDKIQPYDIPSPSGMYSVMSNLNYGDNPVVRAAISNLFVRRF